MTVKEVRGSNRTNENEITKQLTYIYIYICLLWCPSGMLAEVYVVDVDDEPFLASAPSSLPAWGMLVQAALVGATLLVI